MHINVFEDIPSNYPCIKSLEQEDVCLTMHETQREDSFADGAVGSEKNSLGWLK
jgi:hypothetical protein